MNERSFANKEIYYVFASVLFVRSHNYHVADLLILKYDRFKGNNGGLMMIYHVMHQSTYEVKKLTPADIIDMDTDSEDRIIVHGTDQEYYFLLASKDLIKD